MVKPGMTVIGPLYDVQCSVCGESICDGEFPETRAAARKLADDHAEMDHEWHGPGPFRTS